MTSPDRIRDSAAAAMSEFLLIDADMALSFLELAEKTDDPNMRDRRQNVATKAYRKIIALMPKVTMTGEQKAVLESKLSAVRGRLKTV